MKQLPAHQQMAQQAVTETNKQMKNYLGKIRRRQTPLTKKEPPSRDVTNIEAKPPNATPLQNNLKLPQNNGIKNKTRLPAMSVGPKPTLGDWPGPDPSCGNVNFAQHSRCNRCKINKPKNIEKTKGNVRIGEAAAKTSNRFILVYDW